MQLIMVTAVAVAQRMEPLKKPCASWEGMWQQPGTSIPNHLPSVFHTCPEEAPTEVLDEDPPYKFPLVPTFPPMRPRLSGDL